MPKRRQKTHTPPGGSDATVNRCHISGCEQPAPYKAPRSRGQLEEYDWYCLEHIREYNEHWDFFDGMDRRQIESFMHDAVTGHRPTWGRETHLSKKDRQAALQAALEAFLGAASAIKRPPPMPPLGAKMREALAVFNIEYPYDMGALKHRYRLLVKKLHPDARQNDPKSEEAFKSVTAAYKILRAHLEDG